MEKNAGLVADPLFVGLTRPPMRLGVTYTALMVNALVTMEAFLVTKSALALLLCVPVHAVCWLLCLRDPRVFELLALRARTAIPAWLTTGRYFGASSVAPLRLTAAAVGARAVVPEVQP